MVPSYSESFGLVAVEAQACGTPVIAASVGGLRTAVQDGVSGILVDGHDPASYARALGELFASPGLRARLAHGAVKHASRFGWGLTVDRLLTVYAGAMSTSLAPESYTHAG
jgi:D-inositol-3-phosphate glycosyltransferase